MNVAERFDNFARKIFPPKPEPQINLGPIVIRARSREDLLMTPFANINHNLEWALVRGVQPVALTNILTQVDQQQIPNLVLFDTPPHGFTGGNHWRIITVDQERKTAVLKLCGNFGNFDYQGIYPVEVSFDTIMFTGISIQQFELEGQPATLSQVVEVGNETRAQKLDYPKSLKYVGEQILFSDYQGKLLPIDQHPTFQKRN